MIFIVLIDYSMCNRSSLIIAFYFPYRCVAMELDALPDLLLNLKIYRGSKGVFFCFSYFVIIVTTFP